MDYSSNHRLPIALVSKWKSWFQVDPVEEAKHYLLLSRRFVVAAWSIWSLAFLGLIICFFALPEHSSKEQWIRVGYAEAGALLAGFLCLWFRTFLRIRRFIMVVGRNARIDTYYEDDVYLFLHIVQWLEPNLVLLVGQRFEFISAVKLAEIVEFTLADTGSELHEDSKLVGNYVVRRKSHPSEAWRDQQNSVAIFTQTHAVLHHIGLAEKSNATDYVAENH